MSKTSLIARRRKGHLIPIEGSDLMGPISRGFKYVRICDYEKSKDRYCHAPVFFKKVRVWPCVYCGQESRFTAVFHYSGHDIIERLCQKCVKVHGPIASEINDDSVPVCNLL